MPGLEEIASQFFQTAQNFWREAPPTAALSITFCAIKPNVTGRVASAFAIDAGSRSFGRGAWFSWARRYGVYR